MRTVMLKNGMCPVSHGVVQVGMGKRQMGGATKDVLKSLSSLAISATRPVKHLVGGASSLKMPSVIRKSPIGKIF